MKLENSSFPLSQRNFFLVKFFALTMLAVAGFLLGCGEKPSTQNSGPSEYNEQDRNGGIFRRSFPTAVLTLDPREIEDTYSHEVCRQIFDGLFEFQTESKTSPSGIATEPKVLPCIVAGWSCSEDHLTYFFKLRNDCRFHATTGPSERPTRNGGRLISAEDVDYTFRRLLNSRSQSPRRKLFWVIKGAQKYSEGVTETIEGIKISASDTISFTLEKPFAPFLSILALSNAFIVPHEDAEYQKSEFASAPVGAGPFFWAGTKDDTIFLKPNRNYFRGKPYLDGLEFTVIKDEAERFQAFKNGQFSVADVPDPEYKNVKSDPKLSACFQEVSRYGTQYLGFNVKAPPFDDVKVRQAINCAIDRETIVKLILNDRAKIAKGVLPPGILGFNNNLEGYPFDPVKARALLVEAGYSAEKRFPEIALQINYDSRHSRIGEFILSNLRDVGINCSLKEVDFHEHMNSVVSGKAAFFRMGWSVDYPDPDNMLYTLFHSSNVGQGGNFCQYSNPEVDELLEKGRFEIEPRRRIPFYQEAEQKIVKDAPWVFVYHYTLHLLCQPEVRGLVLTPMGPPFLNYRKIWVAKPLSTAKP